MTHTVVLVGWTTSLEHISYTDNWVNFVSAACIPSPVSSLTTWLSCLLSQATTITNIPYQPPQMVLREQTSHVLPSYRQPAN